MSWIKRQRLGVRSKIFESGVITRSGYALKSDLAEKGSEFVLESESELQRTATCHLPSVYNIFYTGTFISGSSYSTNDKVIDYLSFIIYGSEGCRGELEA